MVDVPSITRAVGKEPQHGHVEQCSRFTELTGRALSDFPDPFTFFLQNYTSLLFFL